MCERERKRDHRCPDQITRDDISGESDKRHVSHLLTAFYYHCVCVRVCVLLPSSILHVLLFCCSFVNVKNIVKASSFKVNDCSLNYYFSASSSSPFSLFLLSFPCPPPVRFLPFGLFFILCSSPK